ncbi:monocarboxylate transporter 14 [Callorhinchus milii]|uniref:Monocarboxylate transporter 14 n=1 Tax=Callorhinchus milii TaxID=7868 RepID=V9KRG4_CALMI|nr:monocarboxylate transporter 14 [Callorhinchus milii]XP_042195229.1 monocarboxylate transporter 14 [Callorhinchus milii]|eukprot:gi/632933913/ref/XP_007892794.1/ PREDICTED: monocarboxylate transporter 14 [Callorhinchus milii]
MATNDADIEYEFEGSAKTRTEPQRPNPDIDGGWGWFVVLASFIAHILVMGSQMSLGILYMEWLEEFQQSRGLTAWIGSLSLGIAMIIGPIAGLFVDVCGCRKTAIIGGILTTLGWVMSAFATSVYSLFLSFGVVVGIGSGLSYLPNIVMVGKYFEKRRALAQGISTTGTGFGAFFITILLKALNAEFGWRGAMFIQGAVSLNLCVCGALLRPLLPSKRKFRETEYIRGEACGMEGTALSINGRSSDAGISEQDAKEYKGNPPKEAGAQNVLDATCKYQTAKWATFKDACAANLFKMSSKFMRSVRLGFYTWYSSYFGAASLFQNKVFVAYIFWALLAFCSFVIPFIHLPEIVKLYGLTSENDKFPLTSIIAMLHILGKVILGTICDLPIVSVWNVLVLSNFCFAVCILVIPLMYTFTNLAIVCAVIGFSSGYLALIPCVTEDLVGINNLANAFGIIICANGVSALLGPPFAGWIFDLTNKYDYSFYVCGFLYMVGIACLLVKYCVPLKEIPEKKERARNF